MLALPRPKIRRKPRRGRPITGARRDPRHRSRPSHDPRKPVHVVLRVLKGVPRLRVGKAYAAIRAALRRMVETSAFRVVHASIQHNHLHFLVEAADRRRLSRGMQALAISLARRINRVMGRKGKLFAYRFHATELANPTQVRNALSYVLNNWSHHREDRGPIAGIAQLDPYATGPAFDGWRERWTWTPGFEPLPSRPPQTWLLRSGWRRAGPDISVLHVPATPPRT